MWRTFKAIEASLFYVQNTKLYAGILNERLKNDLIEKEILPDTQTGFRKN